MKNMCHLNTKMYDCTVILSYRLLMALAALCKLLCKITGLDLMNMSRDGDGEFNFNHSFVERFHNYINKSSLSH